jgi:YVTN family beta-propeller protein
VIDGATNQVVAGIGADQVYDLRYDPKDNKIYCADFIGAPNIVTVIDGAENSVIATLPAGEGLPALWYDSAGNKIYCAGIDSVIVIDCATDSVIQTIEVGAWPIAFVSDPAHNRVHVSKYSSSSISVLRDTVLGVEGDFRPHAASSGPVATVVRGVLVLGAAGSRQNTGLRAQLLDITGRRVLDLHAGPNDVRTLAPGVYFIREELQAASPNPQAVRKVVVTR